MKTINTTHVDSVNFARETIATGGILAYPTDTLYGFGVDPRNEIAINRLSTVKGRSGPYSIMIGSVAQLSKILLVPTPAMTNIRRMFPGPYAIIGKPLEPSAWPQQLVGPDQTLSVRIANHPWLNSLFSGWDDAIVTTSINRAGEAPVQDPMIIADQFSGEIGLIVDGGVSPESAGSTMINIVTEPWKMVRQGDGKWPL